MIRNVPIVLILTIVFFIELSYSSNLIINQKHEVPKNINAIHNDKSSETSTINISKRLGYDFSKRFKNNGFNEANGDVMVQSFKGPIDLPIHNNDKNNELPLSSKEQIILLSKQLNALTQLRKQDFELLEINLKNYIKTNLLSVLDEDVRYELELLRHEIKVLRDSANLNKEHLTIQWLSESITELRNEVAEVQMSVTNITKNLQQHKELEKIYDINEKMAVVDLKIKSIQERQTKTECSLKDLQDEALQNSEVERKFKMWQKDPSLPKAVVFKEPEVEYKFRRLRLLNTKVNDISVAQLKMKRELSYLRQNQLNRRYHEIETEQKRLANANLNVSRQVANLEKLHLSMMELLEDVAKLETKFEKVIPDLKHEISKTELNIALHASQLENINATLSTFKENDDSIKAFEKQIYMLQQEIEKLKQVSVLQTTMTHSRINKIESDSKANSTLMKLNMEFQSQKISQLDTDLEKEEFIYKSIINKLPLDCTAVTDNIKSSGLYLISPVARPVIVHCTNNWITMQRRLDGSVNFNRSWNEYANGFGHPTGEYWIGNEVLYQLSYKSCLQLKIEMRDIYDKYWYAEYRSMSVASKSEGYRLDIGGYTGNASNALDYQNHMEFSSIDEDRDVSYTNCAANYEGGWWFSNCQHANLNGRYNLGLTWFDSSRNEWIAVKSSHMLVQRSPEPCPKF